MGVNPPDMLPSDTSQVVPASPPSKRKRIETNGSISAVAKAPKRKKSKNRSSTHDQGLDMENNISTIVRDLNNQLMADYVAQKIRRHGSDLSLIELEEKYIPEQAFLDTSTWDMPRTLENFPSFLERFSLNAGSTRNLSAASKKKGAPHTIVITSAGLRAADITRTLRTFQTMDATVSKLFAKHIKLKAAIEHAKTTRMNIGIGTPSRLIDLLDEGALSSEKLERLVVDCSHIDIKKRSILDMKETFWPVIQLLNRVEFKARYGADSSRLDVIFF